MKITTAQGFMEYMIPDGDWTITAIRDGQGPQSKVFSRDAKPGTGQHVTDLHAFIKAHDDANIYYQPNRLRRRLNPGDKASQADVAYIDHLQVDIDPMAGRDMVHEQERILASLHQDRPKDVPAPSVTVFSGGGYQAFWKLKEPVKVDGDAGLITDLKRYSIWLAERLEGDSCFNPAHLMRLPFTTNNPTKTKLEKHPDRKPIMACVMNFDTAGKSYDLKQFKKSKNQSKASLDIELRNIGQAVTPKIEDLMMLEGSSDLLPAIVCQLDGFPKENKAGEPMFDPERWESRSEQLFFVSCQLVRAGVSDEVHLGILTNSEWGVSDSVLDKGNGAERYATRQIESAYAVVQESDAAQSEANKDVQGPLKFKCDNEGKPYKSLTHNHRVAVQELGVTVQKDQFSTCYMISGLDDFDGRMTDEAVIRLRFRIEEKFGFKLGKEAMRDLISDIGEYNRVHPVCDYLNSLRWDGINRLDNWMTRYLGAPRNDYTKAVGQLILTAAVRRVRKPGCKFDEMVILEGDQGSGKSTALRTLAVSDKWFADELPLGGDGKQVIEAIEGKWIIEAAELAGIGKRSAEHLKAMLSRTFDKGRKAYGHFSDQQNRQCVFFASHNPEKGNNKYLSDPTGNRRFWPVECGIVDLKALTVDRDQLWAEAAMREARGDSIRLDQSLYHLAAGEQSKREQENPMEAKFEAKLGGKTGRIAIGEMYEVLGINAKDHQQVTLMGRAAKALGWQKSPLTYNGVKQKCYWKGDQVEKLTELVPFRGKDGVWRVLARALADEGNMIPDRW
jgi:hypothetical protein